MPPKAFTVSEANALIPTLERVLIGIGERMKRVRRATERLQVLDLLWGARLLEEDNPDFAEARAFREEIATLMNEIERMVVDEIQARGLRFPQGGLEYGLIDFPTTWGGRWVYLCWHLGEPAIEAWHEIDAGFAGRQPLTLRQAQEMGVADSGFLLDDEMSDDDD